MLKKKCEYTLLVRCRTLIYSLCGSGPLYSCRFYFFSLLDQWIFERKSIRRYTLDFNSPIIRVCRGSEGLSKLVPTCLFSALQHHSISALPWTYSEGSLDQMVWRMHYCLNIWDRRSKSRNCSSSFSILPSHVPP